MIDLISHLFSNPVFAGGFVLMISGAVMALCRRVPLHAWVFAKRQLILKVDVLNNDQAFEWLKLWLDAQPYSRRARDLSVSTTERRGRHAEAVPCAAPGGPRERPLPRIVFTPAPGVHFFRYKGRFVWLERTRSESSDKDGWALYRESFQIRVFGRSQDVIRSLIEEAREMALPPEDPRIAVFASSGSSWRHVGMKQPRDRASVILPAGVFEEVLSDVEGFIASESYYNDLGIPWTRGWLFFGAPGSGKTSTIIALAGMLGLNIYILNLADRWMSDENLHSLLADVPDRSIVLLEDVDCVVNGREFATDARAGITFSGLLNALDGAATKEGRLLFMTTNHVERLDPALIRPGRVDVKKEFGHATRDQAAAFFERFYPEDGAEWRDRFARLAAGRSMADIQQHLLTHRGDAAAAVAAWDRLRTGELVEPLHEACAGD